jgi:hypothetical protein
VAARGVDGKRALCRARRRKATLSPSWSGRNRAQSSCASRHNHLSNSANSESRAPQCS